MNRQFVYLFVSGALAVPISLFTTRVRAYQNWAGAVVAGEVAAPYQYRPLVPYIFDALNNVSTPAVAMWILSFMSLAFFALLLHEYASEWYPEQVVMTWTVIGLSLVLPFLIFMPGNVVDTILEAILITAAYGQFAMRTTGNYSFWY